VKTSDLTMVMMIVEQSLEWTIKPNYSEEIQWEQKKLNIVNECTRWLRLCATIWKVTGLIPHDVIGLFKYLIPPTTTTTTLWSYGRLSIRQKWAPEMFLGSRAQWSIRLTTSAPSVSLSPRKCRNFDLSQPYGTQRSVIGITSNFYDNFVKNGVLWDVTPFGSFSASIIRVAIISELGTLAETSYRCKLPYIPPKLWFLQQPHGVNFREVDILHNHRLGNFTSYLVLSGWVL
jgi:hypothetical protein